MKSVEIIKMAFEGIYLNKIRSLLTILGIIIGAATVVLVFAIGKGSEQAVNDQYSALSVTTIYVNANTGSGNQNSTNSKLNINDVEIIKDKANNVLRISPQISGKADISFETNKQQVSILGVNEEYKALTNLEFIQGDFFSTVNVQNKDKVAVIGQDLAESLLGNLNEDYIGKFLKINRQKYKIVGIIKRKGEATGNVSIDESVIIPYTTAQRSILGFEVKPRLVVQAQDINSVNLAMDEIEKILRESHKLKEGQINDFTIRDAGSRLASAQETAKTMSILLISVAAIVLLVGGIGIMNVMLVSVRERVKEIGVRIALGATKKDILLQFLLESIFLSALGGFIGIILGQAFLPLLSKFDIKTISSIEGIFLSFVFSTIVGVFFGYYPAMKAANLEPIDALRYE